MASISNFTTTLATIWLLSSACGVLSSEPSIEWELRRGTVDFFNEPIVIVHPDTVEVGTLVPVQIRTYGGGCTASGPTNLNITSTGASIEPLDSVIVPNNQLVCTDELRMYDHRVEFMIPQTGAFTLRVIGNREPGNHRTEIERTITVR